MNERLRAVLKDGNLTHDVVARAVNRVAAEQGTMLRANKSLVTHWINGTKPRATTIIFLCEALSRYLGRRIAPHDIGYGDVEKAIVTLSDDPVVALARLGRADVDRRQVLTGGAYSVGALLLPIDYMDEAINRRERATDGRIGWAEVEAVTDITAAFNRADEKLGGGFGRTAVVEYLTTDVAGYCAAAAPKRVRNAMFSAGAQLAYLAGWKAHDIGLEDLVSRA
ncbi:MAG TPA: hypothetical protein VF062_11835 [Candidatus Limnocylindrales bacterium]